MGPPPWRVSSQTNNNDDNAITDMSYAGPLERFEMDDDFSTWPTTPLATGRATGHAFELYRHGPARSRSIRVARSPTRAGCLILRPAGRAVSSRYRQSSAGDDVLAWEEGSTEPVSPASITAGGVSLNILLSGPDVPIHTEPGGLEQVAELVPLPESSLALAATLWTVPSDSPTSTPRWDLPAGKATDPDARTSHRLGVGALRDRHRPGPGTDLPRYPGGILSSDGRHAEQRGNPGRAGRAARMARAHPPGRPGSDCRRRSRNHPEPAAARRSTRRGRGPCQPGKTLGHLRTTGSPSCWGSCR